MRETIVAAAREFNAGRYFEAHEVLEENLEEVPDELWDLSIGLIQIAVGYHKVTMPAGIGGAKMLRLGLHKLEGYSDEDSGLRLAALRARVAADLKALETGKFRQALTQAGPPRMQPAKD